MWDLGSQPRDRDQQFLKDQGIGTTIFVGSRTKICHAFGAEIWVHEWDQR